MYDIKILRKKIDKIDKKLLPLFLKRMDISHKVAEYKLAEIGTKGFSHFGLKWSFAKQRNTNSPSIESPSPAI